MAIGVIISVVAVSLIAGSTVALAQEEKITAPEGITFIPLEPQGRDEIQPINPTVVWQKFLSQLLKLS